MCTVYFRRFIINWPQKSTQRFDQTVNFNAASPRPWNDNGNKKPWRQNRNARGGAFHQRRFLVMVSVKFQGFFGFFFWMKIDDFDQMEVEVVK